MKTMLALVFLVSSSLVFAETSPSLATVLTLEGVIAEGVSGTSDPTGFRLLYGPGGEPVFVPADPSVVEPIPAFDEQYAEGYWDTRFGPLGMNHPVRAIAVSGSDVFAGGNFTNAGGIPASRIARWDSSSWHAMGSGVSGGIGTVVYDIAVSGSDVYVAGDFTYAGGIPANHIARWDGSSWSALGDGIDGIVVTIDVSDTGMLYAGGWFQQAGGISASNIARWDGTSWSALGIGVSSTVEAIAVSGSDVYVGGEFWKAGGNPANCIARWDGSSWSPLGAGVEGTGYYYTTIVRAIALNNSDVYVGGIFTQAGGNPADYIARWDGSSWSALGCGLNNYVWDIAVRGSDVYACGIFGQAGGNPASAIARWDGSSWHNMGIGLSDHAYAIAVNGPVVYVGGAFNGAGGFDSPKIACWVEWPTGIDTFLEESQAILRISPNPMTTGAIFSFQSIGLYPLTLEICDTAGRLVRRQDLGTLPVGSHSHYWDGLDGSGTPLASGVYFVRLSSTELEASARVVLIR